MTKAVLGEQGLITEAGYQEQADSYRKMASAADIAIQVDKLAATGSFIAGGISAAAAVFGMGGGGGGGGSSGGASPIGWAPAIAG